MTDQRLRLCFIAHGESTHTHKWLNFFARRGHEVHLVPFMSSDQDCLLGVLDPSVKIHPSVSGFPIRRWKLTLGEVRRLRALLRDHRIDLLHALFVGPNAWYACLTRFRPLVLTVMGGGDLSLNWKPSTLSERWLTPRALWNADLVTCWSRRLVEATRRYRPPGSVIPVTHVGVDLQLFRRVHYPEKVREQLKVPPSARIVLSARRIRPLSNIDVLARSIPRILEQVPETWFLFVQPFASDPDCRRTIEDIIRSQGVGERVRFVPGASQEEMPSFYSAADVSVSIGLLDGTPITALESMACETPVVLSDDLSDYEGHLFAPDRTVAIAAPRDPAAVAAAILRVLQDKAYRKRLVAGGLEVVQQYCGYTEQMGRMERLYLDLVYSPQRRGSA